MNTKNATIRLGHKNKKTKIKKYYKNKKENNVWQKYVDNNKIVSWNDFRVTNGVSNCDFANKLWVIRSFCWVHKQTERSCFNDKTIVHLDGSFIML